MSEGWQIFFVGIGLTFLIFIIRKVIPWLVKYPRYKREEFKVKFSLDSSAIGNPKSGLDRFYQIDVTIFKNSEKEFLISNIKMQISRRVNGNKIIKVKHNLNFPFSVRKTTRIGIPFENVENLLDVLNEKDWIRFVLFVKKSRKNFKRYYSNKKIVMEIKEETKEKHISFS